MTIGDLEKKYPKIFENVYCGFGCGPGWLPLIDILCSLIKDTDVRCAQVKEKFGGLRFYVDGATEEVHGMIRMAEAISFHICEMCGGTKDVTTEGIWLKTLCSPCREKWESRKEWVTMADVARKEG